MKGHMYNWDSDPTHQEAKETTKEKMTKVMVKGQISLTVK